MPRSTESKDMHPLAVKGRRWFHSAVQNTDIPSMSRRMTRLAERDAELVFLYYGKMRSEVDGERPRKMAIEERLWSYLGDSGIPLEVIIPLARLGVARVLIEMPCTSADKSPRLDVLREECRARYRTFYFDELSPLHESGAASAHLGGCKGVSLERRTNSPPAAQSGGRRAGVPCSAT